MNYLSVLNKYFLKYKWHLSLWILFVIISNFFSVLSPQVIRYSFDLVKENIGYYQLFNGFSLQIEFYKVFSGVLLYFGITVLMLAVLKGVFMYFMRQTIIVMSRLIEFDMKNEMYAHYQKLSTAFYKRNNTGDLMSRISEDVSRVRMYTGPAIMYSINLLMLFIMVISTMLSVNPELTLYVLIPLPVLSVSIYYVNNIINKKSEIIQEKLSSLTTEAQQVYSGIRVVKSYIKEKLFQQLFEKDATDYKKAALGLVKIESYFNPLMMLLVGLSTILTIYVGGIQVINGEITTGNIAEFVMYVNMLTWPVTALGWVVSIIQRAAASQKRISEFLQQKPEIISPADGIHFELQGNIEFRNVTFTYPDTGITALKNISFTVKAGQKLALIGKTGTGKTTIAELLLRMYDVTDGEILIDGKNIKALNLNDLRRQIGYVPQDIFLFSDTIENNIAFSNADNNISAEAAAKNASVHHDISDFKHQYGTMVGERGITLSGGQKQRISIARAIIKNPSLIMLDDCLSAVDTNTEKIILTNLREVLKNKTSIIITHRISTMLEFDNILVLENGKIAESGTHHELINNKGIYYELFEKQRTDENILT
jgi:ATP-binding cassette, subfamily B, multidrug efflux pump